MSKKITHEQMREHFKGTFNINDVKYEDIRLITNYITQQEKQEKLLERYKELITIKNEIISLLIRNEEYDEKEVIEIDLEKQIKELENE